MSASSFNRHGALDLSSLAARAKQPAPPVPGSRGAAGSGSYVIEVTERTFDADVIRKSLKHPVVVEFYSPRVATGQHLSDVLAALATAAGGKYLVARINVDASPQIVQALQLQAVPTVIGVVGGQLAPLFQGVLPREQVSTYLDELLKAAVANGIVGRAEPVASAADEASEEEPAPDPRFAAADAALERGDFDSAVQEFEKLLAADPGDAEAKAGLAQAGLFARTSSVDPSSVLARADADPADLEAQLAAADVELLVGQVDEAFDRLLRLVRSRAGAERDRARLRLLELFETLGNADERVLKARRSLMAALF